MSTQASWIFLLIAGLLEICWATGLKYTQGFTKLIPSVFTVITLALSMYMLARAVEKIPMGTAYGVWVGIGSLGAAIMGIILFQESASPMRIFFLVLLLVAIVGLKLTAE